MTSADWVSLSDRSMPGRERLSVGEWTCRAANGVTGRANSCTPVGTSGLEPDAAVDTVEAWFSERDLRPLFQIWEGCSPEVVQVLDDRGYVTGEGADVLARGLNTADWPAPNTEVEIIEGVDGRIRGIEVTPRLEELGTSPLAKLVGRVTAADGFVQGSAIGVLDASALGIFAMTTDAAYRRSGMASSVLSALMTAAAASGAIDAWLQFMPSNQPALQLYESFGFERVDAYHYRAAPKRAHSP